MSSFTSGRTRSWILLGSLALNLFLISFMAVKSFHHGGHDRWEERRSEGVRGMVRYMRGSEGGDRFFHHLPEEDRAVMESLRMEYGPAFQESWTEHLADRAEIREILRAETRDREALIAVFADMQADRAEFTELIQTVVLEAYDNLSDEGLVYLGASGRRH